jgi:glutathione S-transferase
LYGSNPSNGYTNFTRIVADLTSFEHEFEKVSPEGKEEYKNNVNSRGLFPYLRVESENDGFGESVAIARFMCNSNPGAGLYGSSTEEIAQVDEVLDKNLCFLQRHFSRLVPAVFGYFKLSEDESKERQKALKDYLRELDQAIKDKEFFVAGKLTIADLYIVCSMSIPMGICVDAGFRKAIPNFMKYFEGVRANSVVEKYLGKQRYVGKGQKPQVQKD